MEKLRYPIGKWKRPDNFTSEMLSEWMEKIDILPQELIGVTEQMDTADLSSSYRPEGWTGAQVIHHLADSHLNAYVRFKLGLTEDCPAIKPYSEKDWAKQSDAKSINIFNSLAILKGVHSRWSMLLLSLSEGDFQRQIYHPEAKEKQFLYQILSHYAWHGEHHSAHLKIILDRESQ